MPSTSATCCNSSASEPRVLRPLNFAKDAPGQGAGVYKDARGRKVVVTQALGQVFMKRGPSMTRSRPWMRRSRNTRAGGMAQAVVVDIHAEATSEKMAMGHFCDGRASLVVGTHTHVPTADAMILPRGTAYQTDAGMCGDYDSVIGMQKDEPMRRFITGMPKDRFTPANERPPCRASSWRPTTGPGLRQRVAPVRVGGRLQDAQP
jgi:calcineurin-like phosphoesterase